MKKKIPLIILFVSINSFASSNIDIDEIRKIVVSYITNFNSVYSSKDTDINNTSIWVLDEKTEFIDLNNDLVKLKTVPSKYKDDINVSLINYVIALQENNYEIVGEIQEPDDYTPINIDCPIETKKTNGKKLVMVLIDKKLIFKNEKVNFNMLIGIDVSKTKNYEVAFTYFKEVANAKYSLNECKLKARDEEKNKQQKKVDDFFYKFKKKAENAFLNKEYFKARRLYKNALNLKPNEQDVIDGINNCNNLILQNQKNVINNLISKNNYKDALQELTKVKNKALKNSDWFKETILSCKNELERIENEKQLKLADIYFNTHRYKKAKASYVKLKPLRFLNQEYITSQLQKCNKSDPNFIEKKLKEAYKNALKSKKNWLSTFNTYYKYEKSGYLKGMQYIFMMQMMLGKYSAVAKPMGFSKNRMKLLAKKYFYEAKRRGEDVSFAENHIFRKSITKFKNND